MLATILKSKVASQVTVYIIKTFANMRKLISQNISMFERFERIEQMKLFLLFFQNTQILKSKSIHLISQNNSN